MSQIEARNSRKMNHIMIHIRRMHVRGDASAGVKERRAAKGCLLA